MKRFFGFVVLGLLVFVMSIPNRGQADTNILNQEENLWLKSRNNTIVVYPIENSPPYSYKNSAGNPQGLAIDYIELVAEKIGAKIEYLTPRPISQALSDIEKGKGDVIASLSPDADKEQYLIFTTNYLTSPSVIVVRKDYGSKSGLSLNDFNGKRVAVVDASALESYTRVNYPRVVVEEVTDNEVGLQQVVLGEVDAAAMDVASLSYFLSKQILSSVKVVGNTGFESKPSFGIPKDMTILQSIIEKGLSQISTKDRSLLNDKWITIPNEKDTTHSILNDIYDNFSGGVLYILLCAIIVILIVFLKRRSGGYLSSRFGRKTHAIKNLEEEIAELEDTSKGLMNELTTVKTLEADIKEKIKKIDKS